jgi:uncharacterized membrane protein
MWGLRVMVIVESGDAGTMADVTNDLIYEVLKSVQAQVVLLRDDMNNVKARLTSIDTRLGLVHTDMAHQSERQ